MSGTIKKKCARKAVITITEGAGTIDVRVAFFPSAKTEGPMPPHIAAAMHVLTSLASWSKGGE